MPKWLFPLICVALMAFDQPKLVKTKVADGITASIPEGWRPMDDMDFRDRYPSVRAPIAAYTNAERLADFSINISATRWPDANLDMAKQFFKASITNMFDRVEMIHEGIQEVNGKKFIYFEFESRINGTPAKEGLREPVLKYTYQQFLVEKNRTLVFSFSAPRREREMWQATAAAVMKSIKIK
jgi:hypothetical protein